MVISNDLLKLFGFLFSVWSGLLLNLSRKILNSVIFFSSKFSVLFFFIFLSLCWYSHFVHASFSWFHLVIFLYSLGSSSFETVAFISLSGSSRHFYFFRVGFWRFILFFSLGHALLLLHMHYDFIPSPIRIWLFRKTATSPSLYRLAYTGQDLHQFRPLERDSQSLSHFSGDMSSVLVGIVSQLKRFCQFLFGELNNFPSGSLGPA